MVPQKRLAAEGRSKALGKGEGGRGKGKTN
jgi:hypothetical protein